MRVLFDNGTPRGVIAVAIDAATPGSFAEVEIPID
jgi:hypothetical protein